MAKVTVTSFDCSLSGFSLTRSYALDKEGREVSVFDGGNACSGRRTPS